MSTRLFLILLVFTGMIFFSCKKSAPPVVHEPDMLIKQDSFQYITDSLKIQRHSDSLQAAVSSFSAGFMGMYAVSGTKGCNWCGSTVIIPADTILIQCSFGFCLCLSYSNPIFENLLAAYDGGLCSANTNCFGGKITGDIYGYNGVQYGVTLFPGNPDSIQAFINVGGTEYGGGQETYYSFSGRKIH